MQIGQVADSISYKSASDNIDYKRSLSPELAEAEIDLSVERDLLFGEMDPGIAALYKDVTSEYAAELSTAATEKIQAIQAEASGILDELIRQKELERMGQILADSGEDDGPTGVLGAIRSGIDMAYAKSGIVEVGAPARLDAYEQAIEVTIDKMCHVLSETQTELLDKVDSDPRIVSAFTAESESLLSKLDEFSMVGTELECDFTRLAIWAAVNDLLQKYIS